MSVNWKTISRRSLSPSYPKCAARSCSALGAVCSFASSRAANFGRLCQVANVLRLRQRGTPTCFCSGLLCALMLAAEVGVHYHLRNNDCHCHLNTFDARLLSLSMNELCFSPKFSGAFSTMQLSEHAIGLIDHHSRSVKFHLLFNGGTPKGLRPKQMELLGYL